MIKRKIITRSVPINCKECGKILYNVYIKNGYAVCKNCFNKK